MPAHTAFRVGGWLPPPGSLALLKHVREMQHQADSSLAPLSPSVARLESLLKEDFGLSFLASEMINSVPPRYAHDPAGGPRLRDVSQMLKLINLAIQQPPPYNETDLVGFPLNAILDWPMGTSAGIAFFMDPRVNGVFKDILSEWSQYLSSPASLAAFSDSQWMSPSAREHIDISQYQHEDSAPAWGFKSWNDFFIRKFKLGVRPVSDPEDHVIVSACESTPFSIQTNVQKDDFFWLKSQPYSLCQLLPNINVEPFVGGTVYQAFLSAFNYHRWHSPVNGIVRSTSVIPGSYYAEAPTMGFDPSGPNLSQGFIAHTAARGVIVIDADPPVGLMAIVTVGMAEVSSNIITVQHDQRVKKGEQIGYFQFGGSTHCLVFRPGVVKSFDVAAIPAPRAQVVKLSSKIATCHT